MEIMKVVKWLNRNKKPIGIVALISLIAALLAIYQFFLAPTATKEDIHSLNESIIKYIEQKFSGYEFVPLCEEFKRPVINNGAVFIDKCSFLCRDFAFNENGYSIRIKFKSSWFNSNDKIHYLLDVGESLETNRISLYEENNYLKFRIYSNNNKEYILKMDLKNVDWKDEMLSDEWNVIEIGYDEKSGHIFLNTNSEMIGTDIPDLKLDVSDSQIFIGADLNKELFAEGYYDYIYVRKYSFPEPTASLGYEERSR